MSVVEVGPPVGAPELVGRDAESAALRAALADSRPVVLLGESGIGKTSLIESVLADDGRPVRRGGGLATLSWMPYLAVARALGRTSFDVDEAAAVADVVEQEVGADILFVDDLHACDAGSLEVLALLASRLTLVAAIRLGHAGTDDAIEVVRAHGFKELALDPLDVEDSRRLVLATTPSLAPEQVRRVVDVSGGVPLLLEELAAGSSEADLVRALRSRLAPLDDSARDAAILLAVASRPVVDERPEYDDLVDVRIAVRPAPGLVQVRHALLAAALLDDATEDEARSAHRAVAALTVDPLVRAFHLIEAGEPAQAAATAMLAAESSETPGRRAESLLMVARAAQAAGEVDPELLLGAASALVVANRGGDALEVLSRVPQHDVDARMRGHLLSLRAQAAWQAGDVEALESSIVDAEELDDDLPPDVALELRFAQASYAVLVASDRSGAERACDRLLSAADAAGHGHGRALARRATLAAVNGIGVVEPFQDALRMCQEERDVVGEMISANNLADVLVSAGRLGESYALMAGEAERAAGLGLAEWSAQFRGMAAVAAGYLGLNATCLRLCDETEASTTDVRTSLMARDVRLLRLLELGDTDVVLRSVDALRAEAGAVPEVLATCAYLESTALWHQGRLEEALRAAADPALDTRSEFPALATSVRDWATFELGRAPEPFTSPSQSHAFAAASIENHAVRMLAASRLVEAAELFDDAASLWEPRWRFAELRCRWAAADCRRAQGDPSAVDELGALEERVAELSFAWLLGRVQRSLRLAGVQRTSRREQDRASLLSAREGEVLSLAAEGMSDPEIARRLSLGIPTVRRHIGNAVVKLGVATRTAAVASYASRGGIAS